MTDKKRIDELKVGDRVAIDTRSLYGRYVIHEVTKITASQITIGGQRYNKRTGIRIGDGDSYSLRQEIAHNWPDYGLMSIEEAERRNNEAEQELKVKLLAVKIKDVPFGKLKDLPIETLKQVAKLLGLEDGEKCQD